MDRFIGINIWRDDALDIGDVVTEREGFELRTVWPQGWVICSPRGTVICGGTDGEVRLTALAMIVTLAKEGTV